MIKGNKIVVVMPAYNAAETVGKTFRAIPEGVVDEVILVDDYSMDDTSKIATELGIEHVIRHDSNMGYGANQKTCYDQAIKLGADVVVMVHPDYQYDPRLITALASLIAEDVFDCTLGSRILGTGARPGGMPWYKYFANRVLTLYQNIMIPYKLSEFHTGYRAFSSDLLKTLPLDENSDDFIFDNQMLLQIIGNGFTIGEVTCPTRYDDDSSSISLKNSARYGMGVIFATLHYRLHRWGWIDSKRYRVQHRQ